MQVDDLSAATRHSEAAFASLRHFALPPTPQNYFVWYEFHAERNADLRRLISVALSNRRIVDSYMMAELYDLFFADTPERQAAREAGATLREAAGRIREAGADAARYGDTLNEVAGAIPGDGKGLAALVTRLSAETMALSARSRRLGDELQESGARIHELEAKLAAAQRASQTDALTTLPNRRAFDSMIVEHAGQAMNNGQDLSLLMIDIDHFKRVNDTWGHAVGDAVIRLVATTLAQQGPDHGRPARYGGEEFAMLLPSTPIGDAIGHAERLRGALAGRRISLRGKNESLGNVTVSIGAARYEPGEPVAAWIDRADAALYRAKQEGRNRVVTLEATGAR